MDHLFKIRTLTTAINALREPGRRIFQRHFKPKLNFQPSTRLAFDVISGSEGVLGNIKVDAPASIDDKTGRKTIILEAPRIANKRFIRPADIQNMRRFGSQAGLELMKTRIAREMLDMRNKHDRTLEFWASRALRGKIYDSDLSTVLVDYGFNATHTPALTGTSLWSDTTNSNPITKIREWKRLIEDDAGHEITSWVAWVGYNTMDALLNHSKILDLLKNTIGNTLLGNARIVNIDGVDIIEYNGSFKDSSGTRQRFIDPKDFILIGEGGDVFDCPYAPIVEEEAPGGVGQDGTGQLFFSKSWTEQDPAGRWIKAESRPLPVVCRPDAIVRATVL